MNKLWKFQCAACIIGSKADRLNMNITGKEDDHVCFKR